MIQGSLDSLRETEHWHRFSPMDVRQRFLKYRVEREVLDEQKLEEVSQRKTYSDARRPIRELIKGSMK